MTKKTSKKPDNQSKIINKNFNKPIIPNFTGTKSPIDFKPNARFQSINRSRR